MTPAERLRRARAYHDWQVRTELPAKRGSPRDVAARNGARVRRHIAEAVRVLRIMTGAPE